jgi:hypothetical protein
MTPEEIKIKADRAEARAHGRTEAQAFVATALNEGKINAEIKRLAALPVGVYESERVPAAKYLGFRTSILDELVTSARPRSKEDDEAVLPHWKVEPWKDEVPTAELLDAIVQVFKRYLILPSPHVAEAIALWILHAWVFGAWDISPFLMLTSPTKRCGKTTALILLSWLTPRSVLAGNISASAIFRYIEDQQPSLLIDEADTFLKFSEEIRGILNAGHTKVGASTIRNVEINGQHVPRRFSTWAPKVIAGIGRFAGTLEDRSIIISMQRKSKGAKVERCRHRDRVEFVELRQKASRWATDNLQKLSGAEPRLPDALNDRAADNWESLLAVAELGGAAWTKKANAAALALSGADDNGDDLGVELLHDARAAFATVGNEGIFTKELVAYLVADEERPWATYCKGDRPITDRQIAKLLRPFEIVSTTIHRPGGTQAKGYRFEDFSEAWERYSATSNPGPNTPSSPAEPPRAYERTSADETGASDGFASVQEPECVRSEKCDLSNNDAASYARTLRNPEIGPEDVSATPQGANGSGPDNNTDQTNGGQCDLCGEAGSPSDPLLEFGIEGVVRHAHRTCLDRAGRQSRMLESVYH